MTREPRHSPTVLDMRQKEIRHLGDCLSSDSRTGRGLAPDPGCPEPVFDYSFPTENVQIDILVLTPCLLNGGTEVQLLSLCHAFQNIGKKVAVACLFEYNISMLSAFRDLDLAVYCLNKTNSRPKGIIRTVHNVAVSLWKLSRKLKADKVHVAYMAPGAMSVFFARIFLSRKVYASVHACCNSQFSAYMLRFLTLGVIRRVIFVSRAAADSFYKGKLKNLFSYYTVVHNAIPKDVNICFKSSELKSKRLCIGWVGRLEPIKGSDILKWIIIRDEILSLPIDWVIAGEGSDLVCLSKLIGLYGLENRVHIYGNIPHNHIANIYDSIDILFVPSREEAFGLSALEGMARGCVLIASKASGLNELIRDSQAAIQFDIQKPQEALDAIRLLYEDRNKLYIMSKRATEHAAGFTQAVYQTACVQAHL